MPKDPIHANTWYEKLPTEQVRRELQRVYEELGSLESAVAGVTWSSLGGKPSTFPPSAHTHTEADITDMGSYLPLSGGTLTGDLALADADNYRAINITRSGGAGGTAVLAVGADGTERFPFLSKSGGGQLRIRNAGPRYWDGVAEREVWHANTLPYESGTWTPTVGGFTSVSYGANLAGQYVRIGKALHLWARIPGTPSGPTSSGFTISNLPMSIVSSRGVGTIVMHNSLMTSAARPFPGLWATSTTALALYRSGPGTGWEAMTGTMQGTTAFDIIFHAVCEVS